ncbi:MAG: complex I subunit 4 family protein, partial [Nocardioidaceae bacterium]
MSSLSVAIALPAVVAVVVLVARDVLVGSRAALAGVGASVLSLLLLVGVWARRGSAAYAGETDVRWTGVLDIRWHVGLDGISYPLALLTVVLSALVCWALVDDAPEGDNAPSVLVALVLVIETASLGVFAALDLLLFFVFFELALIPMWFVIARWGDPHDPDGRRRAATRFLLFTVLGSALMLVGFVVVGLQGGTLQIPALAAREVPLTGGAALLGAVAIAVGLAVKAPVWPLHIWLPDAHSKAPTVGSVLLAGVFLKLGTYGLVRVLVSILPVPSADLAPWLGALGVVGILYASVACLRQRDLKRLIAYSSVGHMGFVVLGIATMSDLGVAAAIFASVAHGLITGLLFFNAGSFK